MTSYFNDSAADIKTIKNLILKNNRSVNVFKDLNNKHARSLKS